jgi:hypothetical protein
VRRQSAGAACQNYRPVQTGKARSDARSATASLPDHHANAALSEVLEFREASSVELSIEVQSYREKTKSVTKSDCWIVI